MLRNSKTRVGCAEKWVQQGMTADIFNNANSVDAGSGRRDESSYIHPEPGGEETDGHFGRQGDDGMV
jgi:hypothetical protein